METTKPKITPLNIIIILVISVVMVVFYLNKDKILPNPNAAYEELYSTFLQAEGTIVSMENMGGGRRSRTVYTIQFYDQTNNLITVFKDSWQVMPLKSGDKVLMYYNPQNPKEAAPESRWKEIMGK